MFLFRCCCSAPFHQSDAFGVLVFFSEYGVCLSIEKSLRAAYRSFHWILEYTLCVVSSVHWKPPTFQQQAARYIRTSKSRLLHLKCVRKMLSVLLLQANSI